MLDLKQPSQQCHEVSLDLLMHHDRHGLHRHGRSDGSGGWAHHLLRPLLRLFLLLLPSSSITKHVIEHIVLVGFVGVFDPDSFHHQQL